MEKLIIFSAFAAWGISETTRVHTFVAIHNWYFFLERKFIIDICCANNILTIRQHILFCFVFYGCWLIICIFCKRTQKICCIRKGRQANPCMFHSKLLKQLQSINRRTIWNTQRPKHSFGYNRGSKFSPPSNVGPTSFLCMPLAVCYIVMYSPFSIYGLLNDNLIPIWIFPLNKTRRKKMKQISKGGNIIKFKFRKNSLLTCILVKPFF